MNSTIDPITAHDLRAIRNADSIVFRRTVEGEATIEATLDGRHSTTGFDQTHNVYVKATLHDYAPDGGTAHSDTLTWSAFEMIHAAKYSAEWQTIVRSLTVGSEVTLAWTRNNNTDARRTVGFVTDELRLVTTRSSAKASRKSTFLVDYYCGPDNTARMVRVK